MCACVCCCWQWEKLQKHSEEVRERAETAECQIAAISQEYRKLIQEKDVCNIMWAVILASLWNLVFLEAMCYVFMHVSCALLQCEFFYGIH